MLYLSVFFVQWCAEIKQEHTIMAIMMAHVLLGEAWLIHLMKRVGPANPSNIISPGHQWASDLAANNRKTSFKSKLLPLWGRFIIVHSKVKILTQICLLVPSFLFISPFTSPHKCWIIHEWENPAECHLSTLLKWLFDMVWSMYQMVSQVFTF